VAVAEGEELVLQASRLVLEVPDPLLGARHSRGGFDQKALPVCLRAPLVVAELRELRQGGLGARSLLRVGGADRLGGGGASLGRRHRRPAPLLEVLVRDGPERALLRLAFLLFLLLRAAHDVGERAAGGCAVARLAATQETRARTGGRLDRG